MVSFWVLGHTKVLVTRDSKESIKDFQLPTHSVTSS